MRIGFWNVNNKALIDPIVGLIFEKNLSLLVLAEYKDDLSPLLVKLNLKSSDLFYELRPIPKKLGKRRTPLKFITNIPSTAARSYFDSSDNYLSVKEVFVNGPGTVLIACVHLPSKWKRKDSEQTSISKMVSQKIIEIEKDFGNSNTLILGDFNMSPFEDGLIHKDAFHAVSSRVIAKDKSESPNGVFYNPTWNLLGDNTHPPGSYYYDKNSFHNLYWYQFDQILLRPSLLDYTDEKSLEIVSSISGSLLLK